MKLRTSFFDKTVFRKDITRFIPLWAIYFIGGVMIMLSIADTTESYYVAENVGQTIGPLAMVNLVYALLVAQLLFGDLYNSRLCNALHAMPMRRENWFVTHVAAGLCYSLVPNGVGIFLVMFKMQEFWYVAFVWLLGMTLQYVFFFGVAVVCTMCSGNRIAMAALYAIINFVSMLAAGFCQLVYLPMMYGVDINLDGFSLFCPVVQMTRNDNFLLWERYEVYDSYLRRFAGFGDGWGYLTVLGVLGIAALVLGLLLYRRRKLESAGDFVAVEPLKPVFCVVFTLCVGAVFGLFGEAVNSSYVPYLILGVVVGWFIGRMLLNRTVKVFRLKEFLWAGAVTVVLFLSILLVQSDVLGIVGWIPESQQVKSVTVANFKSDYYNGMDYLSYGNSICVEVTDPEQIDNVILAHEDIVSRRRAVVNGGKHQVVLVYELKDGRTVQRSYSAPASGTNYEIINKLLYTTKNIMGYKDWDLLLNNLDMVIVDGNKLVSKDMSRQLMEALRKDCEAGYVNFPNKLDATVWVEYSYPVKPGEYINRYLGVSAQAKNVIALVKSAEYVLGYASEEEMLANIKSMQITDTIILEGEELKGFVYALYADFAKGMVTVKEPDTSLLKPQYGAEDFWRSLYVSAYAENISQWLQENFPEQWAMDNF